MAYPAFVLGLTQPIFGVYEAPFLTIALVVVALFAESRAITESVWFPLTAPVVSQATS